MVALMYLVIWKADTLPLYDGFKDGGSAQALALATEGEIDAILSATSSDNYTDEWQELKLLLAKLAAFKTDIQNLSGTVTKTMYMPYITSQDHEQVAITASKCLAKTVSERDLDIIFEQWRERGLELIKMLVGGGSKTSSVADLFETYWKNTRAIAFDKCLIKPAATGLQSPRDVIGLTPEIGSKYITSYSSSSTDL